MHKIAKIHEVCCCGVVGPAIAFDVNRYDGAPYQLMGERFPLGMGFGASKTLKSDLAITQQSLIAAEAAQQ